MNLTRAALFRIFIDRFIAPRLDPRYMFIPRQFSVLMAENTAFVRKTLPSILRTHMTTDEIRGMKQVVFKAGSKSFDVLRYLLHFMQESVAGRDGVEQMVRFLDAEHRSSAFMSVENCERLYELVTAQLEMPAPPKHTASVQSRPMYVPGHEVRRVHESISKLMGLLRQVRPTKMCTQELATFAKFTTTLAEVLDRAATEEWIVDPSLSRRVRTLLEAWRAHACFDTIPFALRLNTHLLSRTLDTLTTQAHVAVSDANPG